MKKETLDTIQLTVYETPTTGALTMADHGGGMAYYSVAARIVREGDWRKLNRLRRAVAHFRATGMKSSEMYAALDALDKRRR